MARSKSPTLTDAELKLMRVLWSRGPSTVAEVVDGLPAADKVAYSTVQTIMRILEEKGYLTHAKQGRAFRYSAVVDPGQARQSALRYVLDRFFNNSPELLLLDVIKNEDLQLENAAAIRDLLNETSAEEGDRS